MKAISPTLLGFLNMARQRDFAIAMADCFTFTTLSGVTLRFTNYDVPIAWGGNTFLAQTILVQGVKFKISTGLEVDRQQITMTAAPGSDINGASVLLMLRDGAFDGAQFQRDRVFIDSRLPGGIDGLTLFKGRVSTIDKVGRTSAQLTVASPLVVLDYSMPRNIFSPTCLHVLYDSGCQVDRTAFQLATVVGPGSTQTLINNSSASPNHVQGAMLFQSGSNAGLRATVKSVDDGILWQLMYPLPEVPVAGDSILVYFGCDHTFGTCKSKFNNQQHFRGFPNVPPPDYAI